MIESMFGLLGMAVIPLLLYFFLPLSAVVFILVKWRSDKSNLKGDPQTGLKTLLYFFKTVSLQTILISLSMVTISLLSASSGFIVTALAIFIGSLCIYCVHLVLIFFFTNRADYPSVARYYTGYNIIAAGTIGMVSFLGTLVYLFNGNWAEISMPLGVFVVYGAAWAAQTVILLNIPLFKNLKQQKKKKRK